MLQSRGKRTQGAHWGEGDCKLQQPHGEEGSEDPPSAGRRGSTYPGMQGAMRSKAWGEDAARVAGSLLGRGEDEIRSTYLFFGKMGTEEGSAGTGGHSAEDWGWGGDVGDPGQSAS